MKHIAVIKIYIFHILLLLSIPLCTLQAQKVILYGNTTRPIPDFSENFNVLRKNRIIYNAYNDSIFKIHDHDRWVNFFRRRALKNQQIFLANKIALRNIFGYFEQDTIPAGAYIELASAFENNYWGEKASDPFVTYDICELLQGFCKLSPDSINPSNDVNYWQTSACVQLAHLGKDSLMYAQAYQCLKRIVSAEAARRPNYESNHGLALYSLTLNIFLLQKIMTIQEHNFYYEQLKQWWRKHKDSNVLDSGDMHAFAAYFSRHDEDLLRNVYMTDTTVLPKQVADSLMRVIVKRNMQQKSLSALSLVRTLTMQVRLGDISASQAVDMCMDRYSRDWKNLKKMRMEASDLRDYITPFYSFFYLNDISDKSFAKKRSIVKRMCDDIEWAYQHRMDQQVTTDYISFLRTLTTYPRITKYLKPAERIQFLNSLNVATQVTTYAHSVHVATIAKELMQGILDYQPELLVGALGDKQVSEILQHKQQYLDFIHDAGMYHDIGKNSIASVVNNDYRPLTDEEFAIIKTHPQLGLQYLDLSPALKRFHDTTLGHHKWYNGKGGYPDSFDNTKSPQRILIDIVTLSDCLQAATERIGRNYKGDKTFDTVMSEFRRDAGVRYNPDLVNLIDEHPGLAKKLSGLIDDEWIEIYYNIYSQFFVK